MYDVILFTDNTDSMQIAIPLGAFKIASVLRKNGYKTLVINHLSKFKLDELKYILDICISDNTKLIGISSTFMKSTDYQVLGPNDIFPQGKEFEKEIVEYIKQKNANIKFALGGAKTTPMLNNKSIDYVFMGFSEDSIVNLLDHLSKGTTLNNSHKNIYGIVVVDDRTAKLYPFCEDEMVWQATDIVNHKVLPIEIGRGCIFKCKFCSYPLNGKKKLDYIKNAEVIKQELEHNYNNFGIEHYFIVDDTFNDSIEKLLQIKNAISQLNFKPKFWCYARLDLICVKPETLDILYDIGIRAFYFGIETLNEKTGRIIGKGYNRQKQIEMIQHIREKYPDVSLHGSFIAGLPEESLDSLQETMVQLEEGIIPLNSWMMKPLYIRKDTTIGFLSELDSNYEVYGYTATGIEGKYIIWENAHISFHSADQLCSEFIERSRKKSYFKIPGHDSFELVNYGLDFDSSIKTEFYTFRWDYIKNDIVPEFIKTYKQQLISLLLETKSN